MERATHSERGRLLMFMSRSTHGGGEVEKRSLRGDAKKKLPKELLMSGTKIPFTGIVLSNQRHKSKAEGLNAGPRSVVFPLRSMPIPFSNSESKGADIPRAVKTALLSLRKRYDEIAPLFSSRPILHARALIPLMSGTNVPRVTSLLDCCAMMNLLLFFVIMCCVNWWDKYSTAARGKEWRKVLILRGEDYSCL
jgi:hypothetical protein